MPTLIYKATVLVSALSLLIAGLFYIRLAWQRKINPVPATWILLAILNVLSFAMYWSSPVHSISANIAVVASSVNNTLIMFGVLYISHHFSTLRIAFDRVQKWCLVGGILVLIFWILSEEPLISYILIQCLGLLAYFATANRLWRASVTTEPFFFWIASLISNLSAIYPAWVKEDLFSWIFLARAVPSTGLLIFLIWRIKRKGSMDRSL